MASVKPGRSCSGLADLEVGMDFRLPCYRREVFLRFYEFHTRYGTHPGLVYLVFPALAASAGWTVEQRLWFAFINGNTQNPVTTWRIFREFPVLADPSAMSGWWSENYARLAFDTDRRYHKKDFLRSVECYRRLIGARTQEEWFGLYTAGTPEENFRCLWPIVTKHFTTFGRLSSFSYLEYLAIMGLPVACDRLFLDDQDGSRSHRNGLCKVLGRDDLDWHESNPGFDGNYRPVLPWLVEEGRALLDEARARAVGHPWAKHVGYFTLESALCTYKSWHRPNRRYPNVYADMMVDRIRSSEAAWGDRLDVFWEARKVLPAHLRLEDNPRNPGCVPEQQNVYRLTGKVINMHHDWPCFANDFNRRVEAP